MNMKENKSAEIHIRLSPSDKKIIQEKANLANKSVASYLMELSKNKRIVDTSKLPSLILEIKRIGVNINQIAAVANSQKYINKPLLLNVIEYEKEIAGLLRKILEEIYNTEEHTLQGLELKIDKLKNTVERMNDNGSS